MPRYVARVYDDARGRAFIDVEAASVPEAMARLLEKGLSVDGLFTPDNAPIDGRGNLLDLEQAPSSAGGVPTPQTGFMMRGLEFAGLVALVCALFYAIGQAFPASQEVRISNGNHTVITIDPRHGAVAFPWLGLLTMAAWALPSITLRPLTSPAMTRRERFAVLALLVLAAFSWYLWVSMTLRGQPYEPLGAFLTLGLCAGSIYVALGVAARGASPIAHPVAVDDANPPE